MSDQYDPSQLLQLQLQLKEKDEMIETLEGRLAYSEDLEGRLAKFEEDIKKLNEGQAKHAEDIKKLNEGQAKHAAKIDHNTKTLISRVDRLCWEKQENQALVVKMLARVAKMEQEPIWSIMKRRLYQGMDRLREELDRRIDVLAPFAFFIACFILFGISLMAQRLWLCWYRTGKVVYKNGHFMVLGP